MTGQNLGGLQANAATMRNIARSSPWRWNTLRFRFEWLDPNADAGSLTALESFNAWLRRPGALRVEDANGNLLRNSPNINDSRDLLYTSGSRKPWLLPPLLTYPVYDDAGYVLRRPEAAYGEPSFEFAPFSAALDPVELAGDHPVPMEFPFANVTEISRVEFIDFLGRPSITAELRPNVSYKPSTRLLALVHPQGSRIVIDLATSICVLSQPIEFDPSLRARNGGFLIRLLGVDEYMLDELFEDSTPTLTDVAAHLPWQVGG